MVHSVYGQALPIIIGIKCYSELLASKLEANDPRGNIFAICNQNEILIETE